MKHSNMPNVIFSISVVILLLLAIFTSATLISIVIGGLIFLVLLVIHLNLMHSPTYMLRDLQFRLDKDLNSNALRLAIGITIGLAIFNQLQQLILSIVCWVDAENDHAYSNGWNLSQYISVPALLFTIVYAFKKEETPTLLKMMLLYYLAISIVKKIYGTAVGEYFHFEDWHYLLAALSISLLIYLKINTNENQ